SAGAVRLAVADAGLELGGLDGLPRRDRRGAPPQGSERLRTSALAPRASLSRVQRGRPLTRRPHLAVTSPASEPLPTCLSVAPVSRETACRRRRFRGRPGVRRLRENLTAVPPACPDRAAVPGRGPRFRGRRFRGRPPGSAT